MSCKYQKSFQPHLTFIVPSTQLSYQICFNIKERNISYPRTHNFNQHKEKNYIIKVMIPLLQYFILNTNANFSNKKNDDKNNEIAGRT